MLRGNEPDNRLIEACLRSDKHAWSILLNRYNGFIVSIAVRQGLNQPDAEDIYQNVCLKLFQSLEELRDTKRLPAWLARVTVNECNARFRRKTTAKLFSETDAIVENEDVAVSIHAPDAQTPEEEFLNLERSASLAKALTELPEECRMLITKLFTQSSEVSYAEVARELNIPLGSIGPRRARCLARLKAIMTRHGY